MSTPESSAAAPATTAAPRLSRSTAGARPAAPVRLVHLGVGNFARAHLAWYTERAPDAAEWGVAAYTGRSAAVSDALAPQDGLYTLLTRGAGGDRFDVVASLSSVHPADDHAAWLAHLSSPDVVVVSLTVTEAAYLRDAGGRLDDSRADVRADVAALREDPSAPVRTVPARLVAGLAARRAAGAGGLTVVPCDNLPDNGTALAVVVADLAAAADPALPAWLEEHVEFATTMVDRITPATTDEDRAVVLAATGLEDAAPVPTEPFSEWVVQGRFRAGRPRWEAAGAELVDDVRPFEQRKLRLLNGAHTLLAYAGTARGHATVADAVADPVLRAWVEEWWDEAARDLPRAAGDIGAYRAALLERFSNRRLPHALAQIAADGSQKVPVRVVPVLRSEVAAGRTPPGAVRAVAAWVLHLRGEGAPVVDARAEQVGALAGGSLEEAVDAVLAHLVPDLVDDLRGPVLGAALSLTG